MMENQGLMFMMEKYPGLEWKSIQVYGGKYPGLRWISIQIYE